MNETAQPQQQDIDRLGCELEKVNLQLKKIIELVIAIERFIERGDAI